MNQAGGGNCTRSPESATCSHCNDLRNGGDGYAAIQERRDGTERHHLSSIDPRLALVNEAWPRLEEQIIHAIRALVEFAKPDREACRSSVLVSRVRASR